jgi:acetylornithine deacetylase/succinyl-diaminopimelate desuccinylase-like protein
VNAIEQQLTKLMAFKPITRDQEATKALLTYVQGELDACGLQSKLVEHNGFTSLIAGTKSLQKSTLLLQAHIDVVPAPAADFTLTKKDGKLFGRGAYDMLFGAAAFIEAIKELDESGQLAEMDLGVMLTADEEIGGFDGVKKLLEDYSCDVCVLPDAGDKDLLSVEAKGVIELEVTVPGRSGHAARPAMYDNPILKLPDILEKIVSAYPNNDVEATTCSITNVHAGEAFNQVPDQAVISLDIRNVAADKPADIVARLEKALDSTEAVVTQKICEPTFSCDTKNEYVKTYMKTYETVTGRAMGTMKAPGSSDARFFTDTPVVMTRPHGGGMHGNDEFVEIESLDEFYQTLKSYMLEVCYNRDKV